MIEESPLFEIIAQGLSYPEGPFWSEQDQCLYFVEWTGDRVSRWQDGHVETVFSTEKGSGPCGLCQDDAGNFWVCLYTACRLVKYSHDGKMFQSFRWAGESRLKGPNDLVMDRYGGVYFADSGDFAEDWISGRPAGSVYYLNPKGSLHQVATGICYANGIALSKDESRLWVNEHRKNQVLEIEILGKETNATPAIFCQLNGESLLEPGLSYELGPDGMCLDGNDRLWLAHYGAGKIIGVNQVGDILYRLPLPQGRRPTNIAWRPKPNTLYITESEMGLLYRIDLERLAENGSGIS